MPQTFDSIATVTLGSASATIDITSISQSYTDLYVVCGNMRVTTSASQLNVTVNGDSGSNYTYQIGFFNGNNNWQGNTAGATQPYWPISAGNDIQSSFPTSFYMNLNNYSNTGRWKTMQVNCVTNREGSGGNNTFNGTWQSNSAINRITFNVSGNTFLAGTTISIYGILRA
jgi:hypothetical protein